MRVLKVQFLLVVLFVSVALAAKWVPGGPTEQIKTTTQRILEIVKDPILKTPDKAEERRRLIWEEIDKRFDWNEMARRTLSIHWRKRTPEERAEFTRLYAKLLERTYLNRIEAYSGEKVLYLGERVEGNYGLVKVEIITTRNTEIQVLYRVKKKGEKWLVYDVSIEGVSLVNNYRKQFNAIITKSSFEKLMERLRAKVEKNES